MGKLFALRDELAKKHDEGPQFILEDQLAIVLSKNITDIKSAAYAFYKCEYMPFYLAKYLARFN